MAAAVVGLGAVACGDDAGVAPAAAPTSQAAPSQAAVDAAAVETADGTTEPAPDVPEPTPDVLEPSPTPAEQQESPASSLASDGTPRDALLSVPALGIDGAPVVAYRGRTDDAAGTRIQNEGVAASPFGPRGGTGPGGVGNYQVTGHRLSGGGMFRYLPDLGRGDRVRVRAGETVYVYEIRSTRRTSFRSPRSLREQRAAVPGRPGAEATRAMITLSTCRTLEDHAEGNYWSDRFDNPEHRIDKIGVLVATRGA